LSVTPPSPNTQCSKTFSTVMSRLTVTNTLAYYDTEYITAVKVL
jgi:hypothetical protein